MKKSVCSVALLSLCFSLLLGQPNQDFSVTIHQGGNPSDLNPITSTGASARYIQVNIFGKLMEYDPKTLELRPQLAISRPIIEQVTEGKYEGNISLTYEIRPEAIWDNGKPVTGYDYLFSIKVTQNPLVASSGLRTSYDFIDSIAVDRSNSKRFTIYCGETYFLAEENSATADILPEYIFDPQRLMRNFSLSQLNDSEQLVELAENPKIIDFALEFNNEKYKQDPQYVVGSGAYSVREFTSNKRIVLVRKKNWWGDQVKDVPALQIYPSEIIYKKTSNAIQAVMELKEGKIDVMRGIKPQFFADLQDNKAFEKEYELSMPSLFRYYYFAFNLKDPKFEDKRLRQAFAHIFDREEFIDAIYLGGAMTTNSHISPHKAYYNKSLKDIKYDQKKAKKLLAEAGWEDTDKDGILDKQIDGQKVDMIVEFAYNQGNFIRKNIGLALQYEAGQLGIRIELKPQEWATLLDNLALGKFDIYSLSWVQGPGLDDLKSIWHSRSIPPAGRNRVRFENKEIDELIMEIRKSLDAKERKKMYYRLQEILHEELPCVFLFVPNQRIAISKRFKNAETNAISPGYQERFFQLKD